MKAISFLSLSILAVTAVFVAVLLIIRNKAKRGKESQNGFLDSLRKENPNAALARVYAARSAHFRRRMKIVGFEARAVLQASPEGVRVIGVFNDGQPFDWLYPRNDLALEWIGNPGLASSNLHWISLGRGDRQLMLSADTGFIAVQSREATADLCALIDPGYSLPTIARTEFALEKNPASLAAIVLFFSLLLFAALDGVLLNPYDLVYSRGVVGLVALLLPSSAVLAIPSYLLLTRNRVPSRESLVLSMVLLMGVACAIVPGMKRIDQWLSSGPLPYEYRLVEGARLQPVRSGPPTLNFTRAREYWTQFEKNSIHSFDLIHGPLGLWQLDHSKMDEPFRRFYEERRKSEGK